MKKIALGVLVLVILALGFWYMKPGSVPVPTETGSVNTADEKKPALSLEAIKNMEIVSPISEDRVRLADGGMYFKEAMKDDAWEISSLETDYFTKLYTGAPVAYGDLDADGISEAVFVLVSRSGGTGTFYDLAVAKNDNGKAVWVASEMLGDRIVVKSIVIEDNTIVVDTLDHGPDEPLALATMPRVRTFELRSGALLELDVD